MTWSPSKPESVSFWCPTCKQQRDRSRVDGKCPFCRDGRAAVVCVNSYAGRQEHPCRVVGETPKRYRITVDKPTALPPKFSILAPGQTKLVPKHAVRFGSQSSS